MFNFFKVSSTEQTKRFYDGLVDGEMKRNLWSMENRFNAEAILAKPSIQRHVVPALRKYLNKNDVCLDLGCGPGGFMALIAPFCRRIYGVDITPNFIDQANQFIELKSLLNAEAILIDQETLPFATASIDKVIMIDTIHHLDAVETTIAEVARVLKPGGLFIIFEPNKLNPLLALLCILDKNEHGLLRLGTFSSYRKLLKNIFAIECEEYNGVLVGPQGRISLALADFLSNANNSFQWLSPKLFIVARRLHV